MLRPPKSLDAAALASKIKKTKHEFNKMTSEVDAELTKVMERMAERKTWSRLDEVKQEEAKTAFCPECGTPVAPGSKFCPTTGVAITQSV